MIFYFSATGNSKHVAESILLPDEELVSIEDAMKNQLYNYEIFDGRLGIVTPTYDWTIPSIVHDFIEMLQIKANERPYVFYVGTYGTTIGGSSKIANKLMKEKGYAFDAVFDIKMPDTWTPIFDLSDKNKVKRRKQSADIEIEELKKQLSSKIKGNHGNHTAPYFTGCIGQFVYNKWTRNTSKLTVTDACIGCGLCAKKCPVEAIEIKYKKPVWVKEQCVMCLGCLHRCPKYAIECGKNTSKHGQYQYSKI